MAYDEDLAHRIRALVSRESGLSEKRMFGGLGFLINGNLAVSARGHGGLMVRCDPAAASALVASGPARRMVMRGREMAGWLQLETADVDSDEQLARWTAIGVSYAKSLPAK